MSVAEKHSVKGTRENIFNSARVRHLVGLRLYRNRYIYLMILPVVVYFILLKYVPMWFLRSAFYDYKLLKGFDSKFVGWKNFERLLSNPNLMNYIGNTLKLNLTALVILFPMPMFFALMLNELRSEKFKRVIQTTTYFPYFISWVVYGGIVSALLTSDGGLINNVMMDAHLISRPINFLSESQYFYAIVIISSAIKGTGWGSVVYVAAIAGVDQAIYEAARIDGANRWQTAFKVTLPSIAPTVTVLLLLAISGILGSGFDRIYMLQNPLNLVRSEVLDTFVYKMGISSRRFSYTTAIGLFRSVLAVLLLGGGNLLSKKLTGNGLF